MTGRALLCLLLFACDDGAGPADAGGGGDALPDAVDAARDVALDATPEAGPDATPEAGPDATPDAGAACLLAAEGFEEMGDGAPPGWSLSYPGGQTEPGPDGEWSLDPEAAEGATSLRVRLQPGRSFVLYRHFYAYPEASALAVELSVSMRHEGLADASVASVRLLAQEADGSEQIGYTELRAEAPAGAWAAYRSSLELEAPALIHLLIMLEAGPADLEASVWLDDLRLRPDPCVEPRLCPLVPTDTPIDRAASALGPRFDPATDPAAPVLHFPAEWHTPEPLPGPVNTAGAEDAFFFPADDETTAYFYFTPSFLIDHGQQVLVPEEGVYSVSRRREGSGWVWDLPQKVWLFDTVAGEGCPFVLGDRMWICAAACGHTGLQHYESQRQAGAWSPATLGPAPLNDPSYGVGEYHLHVDEQGTWLYYHSTRPEGLGSTDLWVSRFHEGEWGPPVHLGAGINSEHDEGYPFVTADGLELWFGATSRKAEYFPYGAIFRSRREGWDEARGLWVWGEPEEVVTRYAGEPTLDAEGNLYFTHHYYFIDPEAPEDPERSRLVESDIFVARKR